MNFADPKTNVLQMGLREGVKVADLGAGSGHYSLAAAHAVGVDGRVYAIDVQEDVLKRIQGTAREQGVRTIETVWGDIEKPRGTTLRDQAVDGAILSNTLFQIKEKAIVAAELRRILKPGGKLLVIDWAGAYGGLGPDPSHVVNEQAAEAVFAAAGFHVVKKFSAGPHHYGIVFTAP
ncbi:MAG: methyltransferase domain-containing protein [bacterium]